MARSLILRLRRLSLGARAVLGLALLILAIVAFVGGLYVFAWLWGIA